jgi:cation transport regulator ChaC
MSRSSAEDPIERMARAKGMSGPCIDYFEKTIEELQKLGIEDAYLI